jgi:hypothetical protein
MGNFEFAAVQPRVTSHETGELILLSDYLDSLLAEGGRYSVSLSLQTPGCTKAVTSPRSPNCIQIRSATLCPSLFD